MPGARVGGFHIVSGSQCVLHPGGRFKRLRTEATLTFVAEVLHVFAAHVLGFKLGREVFLRRELVLGQELVLLGDALLLLFLQAILQRT